MACILRKLQIYVAFTLFVCSANAAEWATIGAGNATCENWNRATANTKTEILSWMAGFSSAENLHLATEGRPEFRLELLTYDYLRHEIDSTRSDSKSKNERMSSILFRLLAKFPTVKK